MWYKTFYTLLYYIPEVIAYLLHATAVICQYRKFIAGEIF